MIIALHIKYEIPKNVMILSEKNDMIPYAIETKINSTNLDDNDILVIIEL